MMRKIEIEFSFDQTITEQVASFFLAKALQQTEIWTKLNQQQYEFSALYSCKSSTKSEFISYGKLEIQFICTDYDFQILALTAEPDTNLPYYALSTFVYLQNALYNSCVRIVTISNYTQKDNTYKLVSKLTDDDVEEYLNVSSSTGSNSFSSTERYSWTSDITTPEAPHWVSLSPHVPPLIHHAYSAT